MAALEEVAREAKDKAGEETTATELVASGKHLLLYFSAAWCGPCKAFTPRMGEYYNKAVADGVPLEVVFVSSDRSAEAQDEYAKSMPWLEIPDCAGANKSLESALSRAIGVDGIPTLAALRPDDELSVLTDDGRTYVMKDRAFPAEWVPPLVPECEDAVESLNSSTCLLVMEEAPEKRRRQGGRGDDGHRACRLWQAPAALLFGGVVRPVQGFHAQAGGVLQQGRGGRRAAGGRLRVERPLGRSAGRVRQEHALA